jgi:hypothetical protein
MGAPPPTYCLQRASLLLKLVLLACAGSCTLTRVSASEDGADSMKAEQLCPSRMHSGRVAQLAVWQPSSDFDQCFTHLGCCSAGCVRCKS